MIEPLAADQWIVSTLKGDSALSALIAGRVYVDQAPQGTTPVYPYVLYQMQSGTDLNIVGPDRFWTNMLYLVRGVAEQGGYTGNLATIAERIDTLLHATPNGVVNSYGIIWAAVSVQPFRMAEVQNGRNFRHLGRIFRIYASKEV